MIQNRGQTRNLDSKIPLPGFDQSQGCNGAVRIRMHNKLAALVVLGKYLGMFDERPQNRNVIYAISGEPMSAEEWKKQYVTDR